jgi:lipopolysaccharide biosynthesis regulator YciM
MLLPALIVLFMIGWYISVMCNDKQVSKKQERQFKRDNVSILPILFEENKEIIN